MKKIFGQRFKLLFGAGRRDREGIISFVFLILAVTSCIQYFSRRQELSRVNDNTVLFSYLNAFEVRDSVFVSHQTSHSPETIRASFNPNELDKSGWMETGLSEKQAESVMRYLARGKGLHSLDDVNKIRVLSEKWHRLNDQLMVFPIVSNETPFSADVEDAVEIEHLLELNVADTNELVAIRGIGAYSARAIVKYRDRLGGFVSYEQLNDIRALREEVKEVLRQKTTLDNRLVRKICIDTCSVDGLSKLPYLSVKQARTILNYRDAHGGFTEVKQIKSCVVVSDSLFLRLEPYLTICND